MERTRQSKRRRRNGPPAGGSPVRNSAIPESPPPGDQIFAAISERATRLLKREEDYIVDFKRAISALDAEDLVSFANSKTGGAILVGVDEAKTSSGRQHGVVVGCQISDSAKLSILSKASQCVPPVTLSIYVENAADKAFYRIEIPSGQQKPYCTSGGTYKMRGDGRNEPLHPGQLLGVFLETEGGEFLRRFRQATETLESSVGETKARVLSELKGLNESVLEMERRIEASLDGISGSAMNAESDAADANAFSEETATLTEQVYSMVEELSSASDPEVAAVSRKLDALLEQFPRGTPKTGH